MDTTQSIDIVRDLLCRLRSENEPLERNLQAVLRGDAALLSVDLDRWGFGEAQWGSGTPDKGY